MVVYPALVGAVAGLLCRKRSPLASAAMAGGVAAAVVGAAYIVVWNRLLVGDPVVEPTLPKLVEMHAARAVIAFFVAGFSAAIVVFAAAFLGKAKAPPRDRRLMFAAVGVAAALWIIIVAARLAA